MNQRPPKLRRHQTGVYFCRWGGKDHYFSKNKKASEEDYLRSLAEWSEWRANRNTLRLPPMSKALSAVELSERFLDFKEAEGGLQLRRYYAKALRRFLNFFGAARADMIRASHVQTIKENMLRSGYAPKTVNHDLTAIKSLFTWGSGLDYIPATNFRGVRSVPLGPVKDKSLPRDKVLELLSNEKAPANLRSWLTVNYLTLARPIEVVRVVNGLGQWVEEGVFRLDTGKSDKRTRLPRHLLFSPLALKHLKKCEPTWSRIDSYYHACERSYGHGVAHRLRHSAATHLHQLGAAREEIDLLLGHAPPRVSLTYVRVEWQPLRATVARLTLKSSSANDSSAAPKKRKRA